MDTHAFDPVRASTDAELRAHSRWLSGVARALIGEGGDDLAQDAWVAALERKPDAERGLKPWLAGAVRFLASNERRTRARRATRERAAAHDEALPASDALVAEIELQRLIADAVSALDEPERSTLVRRYWHGESAAEIARRDGVPAGTVRARLSRALAKLRERLDQRFEGKRDTWCALLTPLAERNGIVGTSATTVAGGVWTMSLLVKLASCAAAIALAWWLWPAAAAEADGAAYARVGENASLDAHARTSGTEGGETLARTALTSDARAAELVPPATTTNPPRVRGRIVTADGSPIPNAELALHDDADGALLTPAHADARGRVELVFPNAPEPTSRDIELAVRAPAHTRLEIEVKVTSGETTELGDLVLEPAGSVVGRIVDPDGVPRGGLARAALPELDPDPRVNERLGPRPPTRLTAAIAGADGRFRIDGVRAGACRIWCGSEPLLWSHSDVLVVVAGETRDLGDVALRRNALAISGRVESPAGLPVANHLVLCRHATRPDTLSAETDGRGEFTVDVREDATFDVVSDPVDQAYTPALVHGVRTGTRDLVLRLTPARHVTLAVHDEAGAAIEEFALNVSDRADDASTGVRDRRPGGRARVVASPVPFWIDVRAHEFAPAKLGPLDVSAADTEIDVVLRRALMVRGRIVRAGEPVRGVSVALAPLAQRGAESVSNEFPYAFAREPALSYARSDDQGRFALPLSTPGSFVVITSDEREHTTRSAAFVFDGRTPPAELVLEYSPTGTLAGKVLAPSGTATSGLWIGISNGDGPTLVARTDETGAYRFDELEPGRWWIRKLESDISHTQRRYARSADWIEPASVVVAPSLTARFDLDLDLYPVLIGRLNFGGDEHSRWTATLSHDSKFDATVSVALDEHGAFRIESTHTGPALLSLSAEDARGLRHEIRAAVELTPGGQTIVFDYDDASVRGSAPRHAGETLAFVRIDGKRAFVSRVPVGADGKFGPARTCAGKLVVVRVASGGQLAGDQLAEIELAPGRETVVDVP